MEAKRKKMELESMNFNQDITEIIEGIAEVAFELSQKLAMASLNGSDFSSSGNQNCQGEEVNNFDNYANDLFINQLRHFSSISKIISEENSSALSMRKKSSSAKYTIAIDPLDGSSNIDVNIPVGTIFAIYDGAELNTNVLSGKNIIAAGYIVYGSSLQFVISDGVKTDIQVYNSQKGKFEIAHEDFKTPKNGKVYSVNEGNLTSFDSQNQEYITSLREQEGITARYVGSLAADFHRNLIKGGIYLYPSTEKHGHGKLRMLYECFPLAFIIEACGGKSVTDNDSTLNKTMDQVDHFCSIHQRSNLVIGSHEMVTAYLSFRRETYLKLA